MFVRPSEGRSPYADHRASSSGDLIKDHRRVQSLFATSDNVEYYVVVDHNMLIGVTRTLSASE
jgi:hypothetical protein